jgi:hypothetical protein
MALATALAVVSLVTVSSGARAAEEEQEKEESFWSQFKDPGDGKFDLVGEREGGSGFLPIVIPFNEPAIGFGLVVGLAYFHPDKSADAAPRPGDRKVPPSTTFGGGVYAQNGTWAVAGGHQGVWMDGSIRYLGALTYASARLDFYGTGGSDPATGQDKIPFDIEGWGTNQTVMVRLGDSNFFLGGKYGYLAADVAFETAPGQPLDGDSKLGGLSALLNYDTRDNSFTPNRGSYVKTGFSRFSENLGGDFNYNAFDLAAFHWWLIKNRLSFGGRFEFHHAGDGAPFYALPWVNLRGIAAFRYLGNYTVTVEIEPRWKIDRRWSVLGFLGAGRAATSFDRLDEVEKVRSYGAGFRYLIARKLGLAVGADIARGSEETVLYLAFGSAWGR